MEPFSVILTGILLVLFVKVYIKSVIELNSSNVLLLSVFCPTLLSIMGLSVFKAGIYLFLILIATIVILISYLKTGNIRININSIIYVFIVVLFTLFFVVNSLFSSAIGYSYYFEKLLFSFLFLFLPVFLFLVSFSTNQNNNYRIINFFIVSSFLCSIDLIHNAFLYGFENLLHANFFPRLTASSEINPIWTGRYISIGFILNIIFTKNKWLRLLIVISGSVAMVLTGSKSVLIFTLLITFIYFNFFNSSKSLKRKFKNLGLISLIIGFIATILFSLNPLALERRFSSSSGTIDKRQSSFSKVVEGYIENDNYIFGNGLGTVTYPITQDYKSRNYPHNINIEILYEFGIVGILIYNLLIFVPVILGLLRKNRTKIENAYILLVLLFYFYSQTSGDITGNTLSIIFGAYLIYLLHKNQSYETSLSK